MTNLVPVDQIEAIVGAKRQTSFHLGCDSRSEEAFFILHSQDCKDSGIDLRECEFSLALDRGIIPEEFRRDVPYRLRIVDGRLKRG